MRLCVFLMFALSGCCIQLVQAEYPTYGTVDPQCQGLQDGDEVPSKTICEVCRCISEGYEHLNVKCAMIYCHPCPTGFVWKDDGSCCGSCEVKKVTCLHNGVEYEPGDKIQLENPCESCYCVGDGDFAELRCSISDCHCVGIVEPDGTCCGKCRPIPPPSPCYHDGGVFHVGDVVPSINPCEECICVGDGFTESHVVCSVTTDCHECPVGKKWIGDGTCCGQCVPVDHCDCPALSCPKRMQYKAEGECCPDCKCRYKRRTYNPGPVGGKCSGCVCSNGTVTCTPPVCPEMIHECVDAVLGDDCCYYCPNGQTCSYGYKKKQVVLESRKFHFVGGNICACSSHPWFPTALCARKSLPGSLSKSLKKYNNKHGEYVDVFKNITVAT